MIDHYGTNKHRTFLDFNRQTRRRRCSATAGRGAGGAESDKANPAHQSQPAGEMGILDEAGCHCRFASASGARRVFHAEQTLPRDRDEPRFPTGRFLESAFLQPITKEQLC